MVSVATGIGVAGGFWGWSRSRDGVEDALLDLDWSRGQFSHAGVGLGSEAALLAEVAGVREGTTVTIGAPVVDLLEDGFGLTIRATAAASHPDLVLNGGFNSAANWSIGAGWAIVCGKLVRSPSAQTAASQTVGHVPGKTYDLAYEMSGRTAGLIQTSLGGAVADIRNANGFSIERFVTTTSAPLAIYADAGFDGSLDDMALREVQTLVQLDLVSESNRVRLDWGAGNRLLLISTSGGIEQGRLDLGLVEPGAAFGVSLACGPDGVLARLEGGDWGVLRGSALPSLSKLRIGRSFTGETWGGSIERVTVQAGLALERYKLVMWGDSLTQSLANSTALPRLAHNGGVGGEDTSSIALRMLADADYRDRIVTLWDRANTATDNGLYAERMAAMVARVRERHDRFIVISDINSTAGAEGPGSAWRIAQDARNAALAAAYPGNFLDVVAALDNPALREDGLHLNAAGNAVVAAAIGSFLTARGW